LITAKGLERLRAADVVVFDRLVDSRLLSEAKEGAELIDAGKARGDVRMTQEQINSTLVGRARAGRSVCRLKGGDPFVFGRGGEEALALTEAKVPWEVVPGVTSATAAAAYAGIPITHRGLAASFAVVTGTEDTTKAELQVAWRQFATFQGTLVFLMAYGNLGEIAHALLEGGMPATRPAALVEWGTAPRQRTVAGTLGNIAWRGAEAGLAPPVVAIIGDVAGLRDRLAWFDTGPLFGKRVLVTRARSQASRLRALLEEEGAWCVEFPAIRVVPVHDPADLDSALKAIRSYDWITFSSANGVKGVRSRMDALGVDSRAFAGVSVAAIGPATAASVQELLAIRPDLVPAEYVSESVVDEFRTRPVKRKRVLVVRSDIGRDVLAQGLRDLGAHVDEVVAYQTKAPADSGDKARLFFSEDEGGIDIVTFTSSSSVDNLVKLLGRDSNLIDGAVTACMGPITAGRARQLGVRVDIVAAEQTMEGLVGAIVAHVAKQPRSERVRAS
jgi:uroporphyrinogen III methyltransferase/synthase